MVSVLIVSHSAALAKAVAELVGEMRHADFAIAHQGGTENGTRFGCDVPALVEKMRELSKNGPVAVVTDFGSSLTGALTALELLGEPLVRSIKIVDAPLVEGALGLVAGNREGVSLDELCAEVQNAGFSKLV